MTAHIENSAPSAPPRAALAPVMEVFASIQGEGAYVGEPQVFLRLAGCPLRCVWCDTPGSWELGAGRQARVAAPDGPRAEAPWASPFQAACWVGAVEPGEPRTVSVTGGEPLAWPDFLLALPTFLGDRRLHLETAGAHPRTLARVVGAFDHVSLDLKLPADLAPPVEILVPAEAGAAADDARAALTEEPAPRTADEWRSARRRCLEIVAGRDACAKIVVAGGRESHEFTELLEDVVRLAPELPVHLQPATPVGAVRAPERESLAELCEAARDLELTVRVLPQVHRILRVP